MYTQAKELDIVQLFSVKNTTCTRAWQICFQPSVEKTGFRNRLQSHPVVDSVPETVQLCSSGEDETDPLSDTSAVMYGTNATCRRRSKVEAWIESSSHSEESMEADKL